MLFFMIGDDKQNVNKEVLTFIKVENIMWGTKFESQAASTSETKAVNIYETKAEKQNKETWWKTSLQYFVLVM